MRCRCSTKITEALRLEIPAVLQFYRISAKELASSKYANSLKETLLHPGKQRVNPIVSGENFDSQRLLLKDYAPFLDRLRRLLAEEDLSATWYQEAELSVNGQASKALSSLVKRNVQKRSGAYFSSPKMSEAVARRFVGGLTKSSLAVDPTCGAGNLLLAAAKNLPIQETLSKTLRDWGRHLSGFDIHSEFIAATHLRIALLAKLRGARNDITKLSSLDRYFPNIRLGEGIRSLKSLKKYRHVLLNPPFNKTIAPADCSWATGSVNKAAIFIDHCIRYVKKGTYISAILPDVLRSGSRYRKWRETIARNSLVTRIDSLGNFRTANVDVFLLEIEMGEKVGLAPGVSWWGEDNEASTISDYFEVNVGPVVMHRVKRTHAQCPFIHAKGLPIWGEKLGTHENVNFDGRLDKPPFVVIRRTSNPKDRFRAIATIIRGAGPLAVDNHLIVCAPKKGGLAACRKLKQYLQSSIVQESLNSRIRCRHLTVDAIRKISYTDGP